MRKYTTTCVHSTHPHLKKDVAKHLNQDERTAEQHYELVDKRKKAVSICGSIRSIQRGFSERNEKEILGEVYAEEIETE